MTSSMHGGIGGTVRAAWRRVVHLHDTPRGIALGFALGAFIGVFPTFGAGGVLAVGLCALLRLNYVAAIAGSVVVMNPVTTPLFWLASAWVGALIFRINFEAIRPLFDPATACRAAGELLVVYVVGNLVVSTVVAAVSYVVVRAIVERVRRHHRTAGER